MRSLLAIFFLLYTQNIYTQSTSNITYDAGTTLDQSAGSDICADAIIINGAHSGTGTICNGPNPVNMVSFNFSVSNRDVNLNWITSTEVNNTGFELYRTEKGKNLWTRIGFIPGHGTTNISQNYIFQDLKMQSGSYNYKLKQIDFNGNFEFFSLLNDVVILKPGKSIVSQNYPNPSNPKSKIDYQIPFDGKVSIKLYDLTGREVATIVNESETAGYYTAVFDGTNLASSIYFYRMFAEGEGQKFESTRKIVLVK